MSFFFLLFFFFFFFSNYRNDFYLTLVYFSLSLFVVFLFCFVYVFFFFSSSFLLLNIVKLTRKREAEKLSNRKHFQGNTDIQNNFDSRNSAVSQNLICQAITTSKTMMLKANLIYN